MSTISPDTELCSAARTGLAHALKDFQLAEVLGCLPGPLHPMVIAAHQCARGVSRSDVFVSTFEGCDSFNYEHQVRSAAVRMPTCTHLRIQLGNFGRKVCWDPGVASAFDEAIPQLRHVRTASLVLGHKSRKLMQRTLAHVASPALQALDLRRSCEVRHYQDALCATLSSSRFLRVLLLHGINKNRCWAVPRGTLSELCFLVHLDLAGNQLCSRPEGADSTFSLLEDLPASLQRLNLVAAHHGSYAGGFGELLRFDVAAFTACLAPCTALEDVTPPLFHGYHNTGIDTLTAHMQLLELRDVRVSWVSIPPPAESRVAHAPECRS